MSKHTLGPWYGTGDGWIDGNGLQLARVFSLNPAVGFTRNPSWREAEANARLIAAAPDLLEALIEARHWLIPQKDGKTPMMAAAYDQACAAIAKTTQEDKS